jgi:hypothetical protein
MSTPTTSSEPRELASRANDGLEVTLFWIQSTNRLVVSVSDTKTGDRFALPAEASNALDVFYHPFAHAARKGVEYTAALREPHCDEAARA